MWRAAPEGNIDYVNKRVLEYLGAPLGEIIGWGWMDKVHPDDVAFKVRSGSEISNREISRTSSADFEGRTANIGDSRCAENHFEPWMAGCSVGTAY